jgi:hypothetical protein
LDLSKQARVVSLGLTSCEIFVLDAINTKGIDGIEKKT